MNIESYIMTLYEMIIIFHCVFFVCFVCFVVFDPVFVNMYNVKKLCVLIFVLMGATFDGGLNLNFATNDDAESFNRLYG